MSILLDLRGLRCPLPALKTAKRLARMRPGGHLTVLADDPLAALDIAHLCREGGHRLLAAPEEGGGHRFRIERGPSFPLKPPADAPPVADPPGEALSD